jgi:hypothetical protein
LRVKLDTWLRLVANLTAVVVGEDLGVRVPYFARALRPLLLLERLRHVRKLCRNIAVAAPQVLNVAILLALHGLFSGVAGFELFAGLDDRGQCAAFRAQGVPTCSTFDGDADACRNYFADLGESLQHLFELSTTSNFPGLMMPAYKCSPWNALFVGTR